MSRVVKTFSASRRFSSTRAWKACSSASALGREGVAVLDLLGGELHQVLVDDVADMLEVGGEGQDLDVALAFLLAELGARGLDQVELDRLVELVDRVVGGLDRLHAPWDRSSRTRPSSGAACRRRGRRDSASRAGRRPAPRPACRARSGSRWRGLPGSSACGLVGQQAAAERWPSASISGRKTIAATTLNAVWKLTAQARRRAGRSATASARSGRGTAAARRRSTARVIRLPSGTRRAVDVGRRLVHVGRQRAADIGADHQRQRERRAR